jgi:copper oxidase (laccase) domain-containing protein
MHNGDTIRDREKFCEQNGVTYEQVVYQNIVYGDTETYDSLRRVSEHDTTKFIADVPADGLITSEVGVGLFLPVADCVATVMYDPVRRQLAMLHLGRHSTYTSLIAKAVDAFVREGSRAADIHVWMSPSAKKETYRLQWFDKEDDPQWHGYFTQDADGFLLDIPGFNTKRFLEQGVVANNITVSPIDTMKDPEYFSHASGDVHGRIAVLAMMR